MKEERSIGSHIGEFFGLVFEYVAIAFLSLVSVAFLLLSFFIGLENISWSRALYYLPFLLVPPLVLLLFLSPFSKEKNKGDFG